MLSSESEVSDLDAANVCGDHDQSELVALQSKSAQLQSKYREGDRVALCVSAQASLDEDKALLGTIRWAVQSPNSERDDGLRLGGELDTAATRQILRRGQGGSRRSAIEAADVPFKVDYVGTNTNNAPARRGGVLLQRRRSLQLVLLLPKQCSAVIEASSRSESLDGDGAEMFSGTWLVGEWYDFAGNEASST